MNTYGIIAEFNPLHNGHKYLIDQIKNTDEEKIIIGIISSSFVQRGEPALLNKWDRAKLALDAGINLVVELPFLYSCQNAEIFANGALKILNALDINILAFGTEDNNKDILLKISRILSVKNDDLDLLIKSKLNSGKSYINSRNESFIELELLNSEEVDFISKPNNILAIEYTKSIINNKYLIDIVPINRIGVEHDSNKVFDNIASASYIRNNINNEFSNFVPTYTKSILDNSKFPNTDKIIDLLKYKYLYDINSIINTIDYEDGIENRILNFLYKSNDFESLANNISNKRITKSRAKRILINSLLNVSKMDILDSFTKYPYIRILGMDTKGMKHLKNINIEYINKFSNYENIKNVNSLLVEKEIKATNVYSILTGENHNLDFTNSPIIKKD